MEFFEVVEVQPCIVGAFITQFREKEDQITFNPKGKFYCCYYGEKIVGVISTMETKNVMRVKSFYVKKEWRGKGIGTTMLNYVIATNTENKQMTAFASQKSLNIFKKKKFIVETEKKNNIKFLRRY